MLVNKFKQSAQSGFTIVEVTIVVSIMAIVGVVYIGLVANYFVVISRSNELAEMTVNSQNLLRTTVENIRFGDDVRQTNQITDPNAPSGGWNTSNTNFVIIIAVPAVNSTKSYIIDPSTGSPYMNELVYYKNGTTLMERILANPSALGNTLYTTCPASLATSTCRPDTQLADFVNSMTFIVYDQNANVTADLTQARSVAINLSMQRNAPGQPLTVSNSIRVTLRNRF